MVTSESKLSRGTKKSMLTWAHYRFRQRLLWKGEQSKSCKVILVTEEYTSKTCGACGAINSNLGSKKEFKCPACEVEMDRDNNGARNILIKFLTESNAHHNKNEPVKQPSEDLASKFKGYLWPNPQKRQGQSEHQPKTAGVHCSAKISLVLSSQSSSSDM